MRPRQRCCRRSWKRPPTASCCATPTALSCWSTALPPGDGPGRRDPARLHPRTRRDPTRRRLATGCCRVPPGDLRDRPPGVVSARRHRRRPREPTPFRPSVSAPSSSSRPAAGCPPSLNTRRCAATAELATGLLADAAMVVLPPGACDVPPGFAPLRRAWKKIPVAHADQVPNWPRRWPGSRQCRALARPAPGAQWLLPAGFGPSTCSAGPAARQRRARPVRWCWPAVRAAPASTTRPRRWSGCSPPAPARRSRPRCSTRSRARQTRSSRATCSRRCCNRQPRTGRFAARRPADRPDRRRLLRRAAHFRRRW